MSRLINFYAKPWQDNPIRHNIHTADDWSVPIQCNNCRFRDFRGECKVHHQWVAATQKCTSFQSK